MSTEQEKFKHSKRLQKDENAVKKQTKIARAAGMDISSPHKFSKRHAMDCGNPGCGICGNPRKTANELTTQERRLFQDLETHRNTHSNGEVND